jgi:hypothetical protein
MVMDPRERSPLYQALSKIKIGGRNLGDLIIPGTCLVQMSCTSCDWRGTVGPDGKQIPESSGGEGIPGKTDRTSPPEKCPKCGGKIKKTKIPVRY